MKFETTVSPHLKPQNSVSRVMLLLLVALLPGILAMYLFFGFGIIINLLIAISTAIVAESIVLALRGQAIVSTLMDLSAVVTAVLLALALPVIAPWWITFIGTAFAIIIAKQLYGGLGYNPFNPAMAGYVLLLVSFPKQMTSWVAPAEISSFTLAAGDFMRLIMFEQPPAQINFDAITMATPLDSLKTQLGLRKDLAEITGQPVFGLISGKGWEWVSMAYLLGGIWLIQRRVIAWQIPVGMLSGLMLFASVSYLIDNTAFGSPLLHLFGGATMLGAFFIATDPVTASTTPKGRLIYGFLIGALVYIIRVWGGYPDAVAFSVLLMNLAAPTIDYYTRPRVFGQAS